MLKFTPNTMIRVQYRKTDYTPGKGTTERWEDITYTVCGKCCNQYPCEWSNAFGGDVFAAASQNIKELATIRMGYVPQIFERANEGRVRIFRAGETNVKKTFAVYGQVDNVKMQNRLMEFKVQRLEVQ